MESGATRTFKPWRLQDEAVEGEKRKRETEEMHYRIKYLENETLDSKREMDTLAALHEMQSVNSGRATVSTDAMLQGLQRTSAAKV
ncbi:splicing factor YJU2-like [Eucalyptus grandis]|uniref:splicing factor YJU2-like n=1 Tax=Eucalyptus grandis TaxID=71139 RepID=UPI00192EED3E|nr:splicing factor YJU2-like [Eucalyptus grandis]